MKLLIWLRERLRSRGRDKEGDNRDFEGGFRLSSFHSWGIYSSSSSEFYRENSRANSRPEDNTEE